MTIEKKLKNFGKRAVIGTVLAGSLVLTGCGIFDKDDPKPQPHVNQAPQITLGVSFGDGLSGEVDYTVCGDDNDGNINYLEVWTNGNYSKQLNLSQENPFCVYPSPGIIQGTNTLESIATDDDGAESSLKTENFYSPTEAEAREVIDQVLADKEYVEGFDFERDKTYIVNGRNIISDYFFTRTDGTRVVVNNIGHVDDLITGQEDVVYLNNAGIPQFTRARTPLSGKEIGSFLDNNIY